MRHDQNSSPSKPSDRLRDSGTRAGQRLPAQSAGTSRLVLLLTCILSMLVKQTQACVATYYYYGGCTYSWNTGYWTSTTNTVTKSNLADQEYYPFGAYDSDHTKYIDMPRSYSESSYWTCRCYEYATLYYLDETTNDNGWVDISTSYASYYSFISGFTRSTGTTAGRLSILTSSQTETQTVRFKVSMYSYAIYGGSDGATNEWEFDVTVYKACIDNNLTS